MQDLKKYGAIGGAISLALCWPLAVGHIGQKVVEDGVASLNSESLQSEVVEYQRGYLSSKVKTHYRFTDPVLVEQLTVDGLPTELTVVSELSHGLASVKALSKIEGIEDIPLTLTTVTQLNGNTAYELSLDAYSKDNQDSIVSISPSMLSGDVTVLGEASYKLDIPSIEIDFSSGEKVVMNQLEGEGRGKKVNNFWLGEQALNMGSFAVVDGNQQTVFGAAESNYQFTSSMNEAKKTVDSQHIMTLNQVVNEGAELNKMELDLAFGDLDSEAFDKLVSLYQNSPVMTNEEVEQAVPLVDTLFSKGFYLAINKLAIDFGESIELSSKLKLEVPQGTDNISQDPTQVIPALRGNFETYLSNQLVEQFPMIKQGVDEAMVMEMVTETESGYQISADLAEGKLVFENGQEIPLMALLMPMMMQ